MTDTATTALAWAALAATAAVPPLLIGQIMFALGDLPELAHAVYAATAYLSGAMAGHIVTRVAS